MGVLDGDHLGELLSDEDMTRRLLDIQRPPVPRRPR